MENTLKPSDVEMKEIGSHAVHRLLSFGVPLVKARSPLFASTTSEGGEGREQMGMSSLSP